VFQWIERVAVCYSVMRVREWVKVSEIEVVAVYYSVLQCERM